MTLRFRETRSGANLKPLMKKNQMKNLMVIKKEKSQSNKATDEGKKWKKEKQN